MTAHAALNATHDPALRSWVASANDPATDFPLQNLPFGRFQRAGETQWRLGVAIGDQVLDLQAAGLVDSDDMNALMARPPAARAALRQALSEGLREGSPQQARFAEALLPQASVTLGVPCRIADYTDFYVGIHHATEIGRQFRPNNPLLENYKWVPIGYHGRASTIQASGASFLRPLGQVRPDPEQPPRLAPSARLDLELELGIFIAEGNRQGAPISIAEAEQHIFGLTLFNDWSARDIQTWEYQPLGPFLSKSFASTVSPWMVTMEALAPFRAPWSRPDGDPQPLPYLSDARLAASGAISIELEVLLQTRQMADQGHAGDRISHSNFAQAAYWTPSQLVAHHTINGCALQSGDLLGSGTLSGPDLSQSGSLLELTGGGKRPLTLSTGEQRGFLADHDTLILKGFCQRDGFRRIGFGECRGTVLPALPLPA